MEYSNVTAFFDSDMWESIMSTAIDDQEKDSIWLMDQLVIRLNSAEFFLSINNHNRFHKEMYELEQIINVLTK